jgi:hypothetical protein
MREQDDRVMREQDDRVMREQDDRAIGEHEYFVYIVCSLSGDALHRDDE